MKKILFFLVLISIILSSCSTNNEIVIDPQCEKNALELVPSEVTLNFEKAYNGLDYNELPYVLNKVKWKDGEITIADRAFRLPTAAGLNRAYYYPLDLDNEVDDAWLHTDEIIYSKGGVYYVYDFVLKPTGEVNYVEVENKLTGIPEEDQTKGDRVFEIVESKIIKCEN